jgi:glycosyltransferase involved in cell wall biosynthesis
MIPSRMRVLYDNHIFNMQRYGGISRYVSELIAGISQLPNVQVEFPVRYTHNSYLLSDRERYGVKPLPRKGAPFRGFITSRRMRANYEAFRHTASGGEFEIYHPTYHDRHVLESLPDRPFVLTIHDMIHEVFPELFSDADEVIDAKRQLARKAARIIAGSENTKRDIIRHLGVSEERIRVVYYAESVGGAAKDRKPDIPEKYLLFVGNRGLYKNFRLFAEAIVPLLSEDRDLHLVAAGAAPFNEDELRYLDDLGIRRQVNHVLFHTDGQLAELYRGALCFAFPSRYEGFGIPTLEAFACDCPVLLAEAGSLPEVAGDAAVYFDPERAESISEATRRVLADESLRAELIRKGRERLEAFSWQKVCDQTVDVYRHALRQ